MSLPVLRLESCIVGYPGHPLFGPLDLILEAGDLCLVVGPNGCGKSSLLRTILGSLPSLAGKVWVAPDTRTGYLPQRGALDTAFPFTAGEVVRMGIPEVLQGARRGRFDAQGILALGRVGLDGQEGRLFRELSGGQRQRALLARALVGDPGLLLLDEPSEGLDLGGARDLEDLLGKARTGRNAAVLRVTHLSEPVASEVRVLLLAGGKAVFGRASEVLVPGILSEAYRRRVTVQPGGGRLTVLIEGGL